MKKLVLLLVYCMLFLSACRLKELELIKDSFSFEYGQVVDVKLDELIDIEIYKKYVDDISVDLSSIDAEKLGAYTGYIRYRDYEKPFSVDIVEKPNIELICSEIAFEYGDPVSIPIEKIINLDAYQNPANFTIDLSAVDESKAGKYEGLISYKGKEEKFVVHIVGRTEIELRIPRITFELGDSYEVPLERLLNVNEYESLDDMVLDLSAVEDKVGEYTCAISNDVSTEEFEVVIVDTTKPTFTIADPVCAVVNEDLSIDSVVKNAEDLSGIKSMVFQNQSTKLKYTETGTRAGTIFVTDNNDNKVSVPITINVINKPTINAKNKSITVGDSKAYEKYIASITATDDLDGKVTTGIEIDDSSFDINKKGKQTIIVKFTNSGGISVEKKITITVKNKEIVLEPIATTYVLQYLQVKGTDGVTYYFEKDATNKEIESTCRSYYTYSARGIYSNGTDTIEATFFGGMTPFMYCTDDATGINKQYITAPYIIAWQDVTHHNTVDAYNNYIGDSTHRYITTGNYVFAFEQSDSSDLYIGFGPFGSIESSVTNPVFEDSTYSTTNWIYY